jgi:succinate dehydrogenase / fumarate reductase membrane anchor subunit
MQRLSAIALVPLSLWFVYGLLAHAGASHSDVTAWLSSPTTFGLMVLLVGGTFYHAQLGVQVVIEDYIHREAVKIAALIGTKLLSVALGLAAIVALMSIAFGS